MQQQSPSDKAKKDEHKDDYQYPIIGEAKEHDASIATQPQNCAWDDDDFDDSFAGLHCNEQPMSSFDILETQYVVEEERDEDDAWLSTPEKLQVASDSAKNITQWRHVEETVVFLNPQFQSLNTPASRKLPRCANCTRPLVRGAASSRLCIQCKRDMQRG